MATNDRKSGKRLTNDRQEYGKWEQILEKPVMIVRLLSERKRNSSEKRAQIYYIFPCVIYIIYIIISYTCIIENNYQLFHSSPIWLQFHCSAHKSSDSLHTSEQWTNKLGIIWTKQVWNVRRFEFFDRCQQRKPIANQSEHLRRRMNMNMIARENEHDDIRWWHSMTALHHRSTAITRLSNNNKQTN